jgi:hypothetical protein
LSPRDPDLLLRKARALDKLRYSKEALQIAREAQREGADPVASRRLIGRLEPLALANKIGIDLQHEWFDKLQRNNWGGKLTHGELQIDKCKLQIAN